MTSLIQRMVESSLYGPLRAYNEWLGPEFHHTRLPVVLDNGKMVVFNIDRTEKPYLNWLVWTVHGFEHPMRIRAEVSADEIFQVEFTAMGEYTKEEALAFNTLLLEDLHAELKAYMVRENWAAETMNVY